MKSANFLLASQRVPLRRTKNILGRTTEAGDDEYEREWVLCRASDVSST
jgi:hypothetical protein